MIGLAAVALLLQVAPTPTLVIREGEKTATITVLQTRRGPMVRLEETLAALGAAVVRQGTDRYELVVGETTIELTSGLAFATVAGKPEPLTGPVTPFEGKLLVPLALFTDLLPRTATGFIFDAAAGELRRFASVVKATPPPRATAPQPDRPPAAKRTVPERHVVVIDAGHGGPDRGMSGPIGRSRKIHEADITLAVARKLRVLLQQKGVEVVMTRTRDTLIALSDRGRIANRASGDLFISIHVNAANPRWRRPAEARGFETYFLSEAKTEDERRVEEMENEAARFDDGDGPEPGNPIGFIIQDMYQNEYLRESSAVAQLIQQGMARVHPGTDRGVKQAGFKVLVTTFMPAVLVELGFGSNPQEAAFLSNEKSQERLAAAIADSAVGYLNSRDRRTVGSEDPH
jgi:N-acetylmuramoyl-L-alanine amidase